MNNFKYKNPVFIILTFGVINLTGAAAASSAGIESGATSADQAKINPESGPKAGTGCFTSTARDIPPLAAAESVISPDIVYNNIAPFLQQDPVEMFTKFFDHPFNEKIPSMETQELRAVKHLQTVNLSPFTDNTYTKEVKIMEKNGKHYLTLWILERNTYTYRGLVVKAGGNWMPNTQAKLEKLIASFTQETELTIVVKSNPDPGSYIRSLFDLSPEDFMTPKNVDILLFIREIKSDILYESIQTIEGFPIVKTKMNIMFGDHLHYHLVLYSSILPFSAVQRIPSVIPLECHLFDLEKIQHIVNEAKRLYVSS